MAFSSKRGRPRKAPEQPDLGTAELRAKQALGLTSEPIDLCLQHRLISPAQHWCGLHWRWLYTLRYGAPSLSAHYMRDRLGTSRDEDCLQWRSLREAEYQQARALLTAHRRYEAVSRLSVFNERPSFLDPRLREKAWHQPALAAQLSRAHRELQEGLELLVYHWKRSRRQQPERDAFVT